MKIAVFQQICPVADSEGFVTGMCALDTNGNVWTRDKDSLGGTWKWGEWERFPMPEQAPPLTAWEQLLQAQEALREEGRDVLINEVTTGAGKRAITPSPLMSTEIPPWCAEAWTYDRDQQMVTCPRCGRSCAANLPDGASSRMEIVARRDCADNERPDD